MNKLILATILCLTSLIFSNCNKNDNPPPSNTDYIIKAAWKFDKATSGGTDVSAFIQSCYKDNVMSFLATGNGTFDEGASKCNSADPQSTNFTWNFTDNGNTLNINSAIIAGRSGAFKVIVLNDTQMELETTISTPSGNVTGQIYFKH